MSHELEQLLHRTAVEPSDPLDTRQVVARGRRRRRVRHATTAAGSVAAALLAAGVVLSGLTTDPQPPEIVERPDPAQPHPEDHDPEETDGREDGEDETPPDADLEEVSSIAPRDAGRSLLVADDRGVHRLDENGEQRLWDTPVVVALPDGAGGVVVQEPDDGAIRRLPADGAAPQPPLAAADQRPTLHAVVERDGQPTVLFTRRGGQGDAETETLHAHHLDDGTEEDLGVTGALESGISGVALVDGDLVLSRCHLECDLLRVPWGADPEGEQAVELNDQKLPVNALDAYDTTVVVVDMPFHVPNTQDPGDDGGREAHLRLHDLANGERDELVLPTPDAVDTAPISIDVAHDGTAALVGFHHPQQEARTLFVDGLDQEPRLAWLATDGTVRLDTPQ